MWEMRGGGRKRGRPRSRWIDGGTEDTGMNVYQMVEAAKDRMGWRSIVQAVTRVGIDLRAEGEQGEYI